MVYLLSVQLISCAVTAQLFCGFVFAYANCWFSRAVAQSIAYNGNAAAVAPAKGKIAGRTVVAQYMKYGTRIRSETGPRFYTMGNLV